MFRPMLKVVTSTAAALALLAAAMLPAEHVHHSSVGHPHSTAHRHAAFHVSPDSHDDQAAHVETGEASDDDGPAVWLTNASVGRNDHMHVSSPVERWVATARPMPVGGRFAPNYDFAPPHGPPRRSVDSRGPPLSRLA